MLVCKVPGEPHRADGLQRRAQRMIHWAGAWGRSRREAFKQHQWGKLAPSRHTFISFSLLGTVSKYDNVFIPSVKKVNVFLIRMHHCTGRFWLLVPAGVVMLSSVWKDAPTLLTGLVWGQMIPDAVLVRRGWHRQVTAITPWPAASGT